MRAATAREESDTSGQAFLSFADLQALADILARARPPLARLAGQDHRPEPRLMGDENDSKRVSMLIKAKDLFAARQRRARFFPRRIFGEPAWDILLALFIHDRSERITLTQIVLLVDSPTTTVTRWLKFMEQERLIVVRKDWRDGRVSIVELADEGRSRISEYLEDDSHPPARRALAPFQ